MSLRATIRQLYKGKEEIIRAKSTFHVQAAKVFKTLAELHVPIYLNVNVKSEFIELYRKVAIPKGMKRCHRENELA